MTNGSGVSRGDRNRNARLARLRELVPLEHAIVGIDLADTKQMVVVCDHDSRVLAQEPVGLFFRMHDLAPNLGNGHKEVGPLCTGKLSNHQVRKRRREVRQTANRH